MLFTIAKIMFIIIFQFCFKLVFRMYGNDIYPKIQGIYPKITFPVSRGTPSIHSLPFWDHRESWQPLPSSKLLKVSNVIILL